MGSRSNTGPANTRPNYRYREKDCPGHEYVGKLNEGHCALVWTCGNCGERTTKVWQCRLCGYTVCNMCYRYSSKVTGKQAKEQPKYIDKKYG
ncbi:hypothetical protein LTR10_012596 [Elasticomyces elasticus]|uniref:GATA-type domain-containing protein n=1 Tax=Exophiala sideris TaxID=1016849 RepID=A0ABR0JTE4_9EURO|nr:hypothetical protein LTR10_012596 [Elasticomyces elasticus]KAK5040203.1 hypothetical protein LTS07_000700 [Exophiala sideris]KAK5043371.1 hypothetical protein LTR13_001142 [Exophiala sideris]KAK5068581.1 hypothetical protein LTR69_000701 [Exophiala sideris]KAK5186179.1 hypothetical protein LTR44_001234 [Eurotiomycetes sp. CCFEE 6388]